MDWDEVDRDVFADDVRPFFGETPEHASPRVQASEREPRRGTFEEIRQWRINDGLCARASCGGVLDAEGCCGFCGWSLTEERARLRLERKDAAA